MVKPKINVMIAFSKMGGAFRRADNGWFDESGDLALDLRIVGIFDKFNKSNGIWDSSNTFYTRTPFANGSYRSIYGMIQRNEADITFTDIPLPGDDIGFTGPVMSENYIAIRSVPSFNTKAIDLAECLFDIDTRVVLLLIMTLMAVSAILRQSWKRNGTKMAAVWKVSCWLRQADAGPIEGHSGQIAAIFMFVSMSFFYMIWSNLFVTDMISVDDSDVVTSLDDVMRLNKSSMLDGEDPMIQHFLLSSQKHASIFREKIYPTAKTKLALDDPDGYSNKYARFGGYQIMRFVSDMYCIMRQTTGYHAQYYYFAPRRYGSVLQAPLMSKQISGENRLKLEKYWYQLSESGIRNFIFRDMGKAFEKMSAYKTPIAGCYILSIAEKVSEVMNQYRSDINITSLVGFLELVFILLAVALSALLCENIWCSSMIRKICRTLTKKSRKRKNKKGKRKRQVSLSCQNEISEQCENSLF